MNDSEEGRLELFALLERLSPAACGRVLTAQEPTFLLYIERLRACVHLHTPNFGVEAPLLEVIQRLEAGDLGHGRVPANLLADLVLAQALELRESHAARVFEAECMPVVRGVARRVGGERAIESVENFAAELILPRDAEPPRIATYEGRTPLRYWLRTVVANFCLAQTRKRRLPVAPQFVEPSIQPDHGAQLEEMECAKLLQPILAASVAVLEPNDLLILQMLNLDHAPQNALARSLGIHSGTVTRRRQQATARLLQRVGTLVAECVQPQQARDCLQLMLGDARPELRRELASILATSVTRGAKAVTP